MHVPEVDLVPEHEDVQELPHVPGTTGEGGSVARSIDDAGGRRLIFLFSSVGPRERRTGRATREIATSPRWVSPRNARDGRADAYFFFSYDDSPLFLNLLRMFASSFSTRSSSASFDLEFRTSWMKMFNPRSPATPPVLRPVCRLILLMAPRGAFARASALAPRPRARSRDALLEVTRRGTLDGRLKQQTVSHGEHDSSASSRSPVAVVASTRRC